MTFISLSAFVDCINRSINDVEDLFYKKSPYLTIIDGDIHLNARFDADARDLLNDVAGSVQIDQPLVNAHLKFVPRVGTLSAGSLAGRDAQLLGGHADGTGNLELLVRGLLLQVRAHLLEVLDVARGESDTDAMHLRGARIFESGFFLTGGDVGGHFELVYGD